MQLVSKNKSRNITIELKDKAKSLIRLYIVADPTLNPLYQQKDLFHQPKGLRIKQLDTRLSKHFQSLNSQ